MRRSIRKRLVSSAVAEMTIKSVIGAGVVVSCVWRTHTYVAKEAVLIVQSGKWWSQGPRFCFVEKERIIIHNLWQWVWKLGWVSEYCNRFSDCKNVGVFPNLLQYAWFRAHHTVGCTPEHQQRVLYKRLDFHEVLHLFLLMTNLTHFFIYLFISSPYVFRASQCSSSGDQIVLIHHLTWLVCVSDCLVCRSWPTYQAVTYTD